MCTQTSKQIIHTHNFLKKIKLRKYLKTEKSWVLSTREESAAVLCDILRNRGRKVLGKAFEISALRS